MAGCAFPRLSGFEREWPPQVHVFEYLFLHWWNCLGRIRGVILLEEVLSLREGSEGSKVSIPSVLSLPLECESSCELSAIPAATLLLCYHGL